MTRVSDVVLDLSGIRVALRGLPLPVAQSIQQQWKRFVTVDEQPPWIELQAEVSGAPARDGPLILDDLESEFAPGRARFAIPEGAIEIEAQGSARLRLAPCSSHRQFWALVNLLVAALAWSLPSRGAALLHAAGVVIRERAFALVGPSQSGKTTWSMLAREGGATFLSDDLLFVDTSGPRVEALSTPIRADFPEPRGPGRWPIAALLLPVHGQTPALAPVSALRAAGRVAANLPFVGGTVGTDPRLDRVLRRLIEAVPAFELTFALDPGFLTCLEELASAR